MTTTNKTTTPADRNGFSTITAVELGKARWDRALRRWRFPSIAGVSTACGHDTTMHHKHAIVGAPVFCPDCFFSPDHAQ